MRTVVIVTLRNSGRDRWWQTRLSTTMLRRGRERGTARSTVVPLSLRARSNQLKARGAGAEIYAGKINKSDVSLPWVAPATVCPRRCSRFYAWMRRIARRGDIKLVTIMRWSSGFINSDSLISRFKVSLSIPSSKSLPLHQRSRHGRDSTCLYIYIYTHSCDLKFARRLRVRLYALGRLSDRHEIRARVYLSNLLNNIRLWADTYARTKTCDVSR